MALDPHVPEIAGVIQLAVAPVFLLTAIGTLIAALNIRLGRAVDRRRELEERLPSLPADQTYQAWYLIDDQPVSAGLMSVGNDGMAMLARIPHHSGTDVIALTIERAGGAAAPSSAPIVAGDMGPAA